MTKTYNVNICLCIDNIVELDHNQNQGLGRALDLRANAHFTK